MNCTGVLGARQVYGCVSAYRPNNALQLTASSLRFAALRFGFRQQLKASVAMTSNVKSWEQLFSGHHIFFVLGASEEAEPVRDDG